MHLFLYKSLQNPVRGGLQPPPPLCNGLCRPPCPLPGASRSAASSREPSGLPSRISEEHGAHRPPRPSDKVPDAEGGGDRSLATQLPAPELSQAQLEGDSVTADKGAARNLRWAGAPAPLSQPRRLLHQVDSLAGESLYKNTLISGKRWGREPQALGSRAPQQGVVAGGGQRCGGRTQGSGGRGGRGGRLHVRTCMGRRMPEGTGICPRPLGADPGLTAAPHLGALHPQLPQPAPPTLPPPHAALLLALGSEGPTRSPRCLGQDRPPLSQPIGRDPGTILRLRTKASWERPCPWPPVTLRRNTLIDYAQTLTGRISWHP